MAEVRIANKNLQPNAHVAYALSSSKRGIYGIGLSTAKRICKELGINPATKVSDLTDAEVKSLRDLIATMEVEGDLRRKVAMNIKRQMDIRSYRGSRHRGRLPVRGQRSRTNARTRKGGRGQAQSTR